MQKLFEPIERNVKLELPTMMTLNDTDGDIVNFFVGHFKSCYIPSSNRNLDDVILAQNFVIATVINTGTNAVYKKLQTQKQI